MELDDIAAEAVDQIEGWQGELLFDVVHLDLLLEAEVIEQVLVGDGGDAGDAAGPEVNRHPVNRLVVERGPDPAAAGYLGRRGWAGRHGRGREMIGEEQACLQPNCDGRPNTGDGI